MRKDRMWILACNDKHDEGEKCEGFLMVARKDGRKYLPIFPSRELAEMEAGDAMHPGSEVEERPRPVLVEIREVGLS